MGTLRPRLARVLAGCLLLSILLAAGLGCRREKERGGALELYVTDAAVVRGEFPQYAGRKLDDAALRRIERAHKLAKAGDYHTAIAILGDESVNGGTPALHTDLGVLYTALGDYFNAQESFQAALRQDGGYRAALKGLERLKTPGLIADLPVTREVEPNNSLVRANRIALNVGVTAEVQDHTDIDSFLFKAPGGARDLLEITVVNRSNTLTPYLRIHDGDQSFLLWNKDATQPGTSVTQYFSPVPDANYFLEVWGQNRTAGAYTLRVRPLKAYDAYEPNDDIVHASRIAAEGRIEAGIMDARDMDYYAFTSMRGGKVFIVVENRSATLVPSVTVHGPDRTLIGFGPKVKQPGAGLTHSIETVAGQTYYVQVWGRMESSGQYALVLK
jgi:hypothetical protein